MNLERIWPISSIIWLNHKVVRYLTEFVLFEQVVLDEINIDFDRLNTEYCP